MMEMPLEAIAEVLSEWQTDPVTAERKVRSHIHTLQEKIRLAETVMRLLVDDFSNHKEQDMSFNFTQSETLAQTVLSVRKQIKVPAFHAWIEPTLKALWDHIRESGAEPSADPLCLYYGPVNEKDDGPVEIAIPFSGVVMPKDDMMVRELPAHHVVEIRTYGEYNEYPKLLEMWDAIGRYVHEKQFESNWDHHLACYERWHEDCSMTICWPVRALKASAV